MQDVAEAVRQGVRGGQEAVVGRVIDVKGFSTLPGDVLRRRGLRWDSARGDAGSARRRTVAESGGGHAGGRRPRPGDRDRSASTARRSPRSVSPAAVRPSCSSSRLPPSRRCCGSCWRPGPRPPCSPASRAPAPARRPRSSTGMVRAGARWATGQTQPGWSKKRWRRWRRVVRRRRRIEDGHGVVLLEAWVPAPRLVVVGSGDMVAAIRAQGALLGWDCQATEDPAQLDELFAWAGATAALIVLSHDPHVDTPALAAGLARRRALRGRHGLAGHPVPPASSVSPPRGSTRPHLIASTGRSA